MFIESFHVTSYQANFATHHSCDRHVGFLFQRSGIGKHKRMCYKFIFLSSSYHNIIPTYNWVTRIYTFDWNFKSFYKVNQKYQRVLFRYTAPYKKETKAGRNRVYIGAYRIVQTMLVSSLHGLVLETQQSVTLLFFLVHATIPNYNWVAHTHTPHTHLTHPILHTHTHTHNFYTERFVFRKSFYSKQWFFFR